MAKFMDVHSGFVGVTGAAARARPTSATWRSRSDEGVHFERAWLDPEAGKVFCLVDRAVEGGGHAHPRAGRAPDGRGLRDSPWRWT